ncbi:MAG: MATE family efflux transporter [Oscillospiraceae bacterium]|nr:MATE family efflux transporter [Oscillospiraceae bacterium]
MSLNQNANRFFAEAPVGKLLLKFSVPCIMSFLINSLYNIVDQIFIGHGVGYLGNGATNVVFPITVIALAVSLLIGNGCSANFSLCQGRGDHEAAKKSVGNCIVAIIVSSIVLTLLFIFLMEPILKAFGATENNIGYAREYYKYLVIGTPFNMFGISLVNIIRADGSPRYAMITTIIGCVSNVILDAIAVMVLDWGMMGAAVATVIGQIITAARCLWYLCRKTKTFKLAKTSFKINFKLLGRFTSLGASSFFSQVSLVLVMISMNNVLVHYGALSRFGEDIPLTVLGIVMKVFSILSGIGMGLAIGAQPIVGYNYGAGNISRVKDVYKKMMITEFIIGLVATAIFMLFPLKIISIFGSGDALYNEFAVLSMRIYLSSTVLFCLQKGCSIFMQALGKPTLSMVMTLLREIVLHIPFIFIMPIFFGVEGVLLTMPICDIGALILTIIISVKVVGKLKPADAHNTAI